MEECVTLFVKISISQSDIYQMYAYAKKYKANKVILIYPHTDNFPKEQNWQFEKNISLSIVPAKLSYVIGDEAEVFKF